MTDLGELIALEKPPSKLAKIDEDRSVKTWKTVNDLPMILRAAHGAHVFGSKAISGSFTSAKVELFHEKLPTEAVTLACATAEPYVFSS